jgi:opacity protein-like surface antigen
MKMMRFHWLVLACSTAAFAQSFEASVSGGQTVIPPKNASIGTVGADPGSDAYKMTDGFRLGARMTLNQWRFMGHEFGYMYSRTGLNIPASASSTGGSTTPTQPGSATATPTSSHLSVPTHQGFYNFLVYAAPEGFIVRPFVTGGVQFTAFSLPNDYGNRETKYGINYGAGVKVKVKEPWGFRLDVRQYNMGKPFKIQNNSGRLLMWEFSGGISFLL